MVIGIVVIYYDNDSFELLVYLQPMNNFKNIIAIFFVDLGYQLLFFKCWFLNTQK